LSGCGGTEGSSATSEISPETHPYMVDQIELGDGSRYVNTYKSHEVEDDRYIYLEDSVIYGPSTQSSDGSKSLSIKSVTKSADSDEDDGLIGIDDYREFEKLYLDTKIGKTKSLLTFLEENNITDTIQTIRLFKKEQEENNTTIDEYVDFLSSVDTISSDSIEIGGFLDYFMEDMIDDVHYPVYSIGELAKTIKDSSLTSKNFKGFFETFKEENLTFDELAALLSLAKIAQYCPDCSFDELVEKLFGEHFKSDDILKSDVSSSDSNIELKSLKSKLHAVKLDSKGDKKDDKKKFGVEDAKKFADNVFKIVKGAWDILRGSSTQKLTTRPIQGYATLENTGPGDYYGGKYKSGNLIEICRNVHNHEPLEDSHKFAQYGFGTHEWNCYNYINLSYHVIYDAKLPNDTNKDNRYIQAASIDTSLVHVGWNRSLSIGGQVFDPINTTANGSGLNPKLKFHISTEDSGVKNSYTVFFNAKDGFEKIIKPK